MTHEIDLTIPDFLDRKNPICIALLNAAGSPKLAALVRE